MPTDDLRRASAEALLEQHVGKPLRGLTGELFAELAERIAAALALLHPVAAVTDLRTHDAHCHQRHAGCLAARTIATLTGEDTTDAR